MIAVFVLFLVRNNVNSHRDPDLAYYFIDSDFKLSEKINHIKGIYASTDICQCYSLEKEVLVNNFKAKLMEQFPNNQGITSGVGITWGNSMKEIQKSHILKSAKMKAMNYAATHIE